MTRPASAETAPASSAAASGLTINAMFAETVARHGDKTALLHKTGGKDGTWTPITYNELAERVRRVAGGLRALGVNPGDRVALLS